MKTLLLVIVLLLAMVTPTHAVDLEPLRGEYDPCLWCGMGYWVYCWQCSMIISWESGNPWGWWE